MFRVEGAHLDGSCLKKLVYVKARELKKKVYPVYCSVADLKVYAAIYVAYTFERQQDSPSTRVPPALPRFMYLSRH